MRRALPLVALALILVQSGHALGLPLPTRLAQALEVPGNSTARSAALAVDLETGEVLFARHPDESLAPASNEKLTVSFAALRELGVSFRFRTEVLGRGSQEGSVWHGDVFLKGFGDPTLDSSRLSRLAARLAQLGITRIDGRVLADESWFDRERSAPGWKSGFLGVECPPLSSLVVDRAWYDRHVAARPAVAAGGRFRQLLRRHGISTGPVGLGRAPDASLLLAQTLSAPLPTVLAEMDHESDNFVAEMLLKTIGAEVSGTGTTAAGAAVVLRDLRAAGVPMAGVRVVDGSGLSVDDRLTARAIAAILFTAWNDSSLHAPFWRAMAVAGVNGTLEHRMQHRPARGAVHAKTGTTDEASALSGFVRDRFAFAVLQNGRPVAERAAEKAQDRFATALASVAASTTGE